MMNTRYRITKVLCDSCTLCITTDVLFFSLTLWLLVPAESSKPESFPTAVGAGDGFWELVFCGGVCGESG